MNKIKVGVLGATGAVGQRFVQMLQGHPWFEITALCASDRNAGKRYVDACRWNLRGDMPVSVREMVLAECEPGPDCKIVFSALPSEIAGEVEEEFAAAGYIVCSNSRNHRYDPDVPLLIPEVNPEHLQLIDIQRRNRGWEGYITTNPNCSTTHLVSALHPLHAALWGEEGLRRDHAGRERRGLSGRQQHGHPGQCCPLHQRRRREDGAEGTAEAARHLRRPGHSLCGLRGERPLQSGGDPQRPPGGGECRVCDGADPRGDSGSLARLQAAGATAQSAQRAPARHSLRRSPGSAAAAPGPHGGQRAGHGDGRRAPASGSTCSTSSSWCWATTPSAVRPAAACSTPNCWWLRAMSVKARRFRRNLRG